MHEEVYRVTQDKHKPPHSDNTGNNLGGTQCTQSLMQQTHLHH
jgi:hypothetical protein